MSAARAEHEYTDEELDSNWQPNARRPQSTIARSFSAELMDIFKIDESVADLDDRVDKRKQTISMQTNELQSLEQRLREMEERLRSANSGNSSVASSNTGSPPQNQRHPVAGAFHAPSSPSKGEGQQSGDGQ